MAQGVLTALQAALAGVSGGITGAQQYREMEAKRKREAEAANMQRDLFRLQLIQASGGRLAPPTEPVRAAGAAAPAMTMPSTDTVLQRALARTQTQAFGPMATQATQAALEPGRRQALGMETPPLARTSLGELLDRQTGRVGMAGAMPTPTPMAESAPAPVRLTSQPPAVPTPTRRRETLGGMEFEVIPGDTPEEKAQRELDLYRRQKEIDVQVAGQKAKTDAEAAKALKDQRIQTLMDAGMERKDAIKAVELEAKYGDVVVTPSAQLTAETTRRGQTLSYNAAMARLDQEGGKTPASEIEKRLPVGARNDIADYNAAIRTLQEAQKEVANNPDAFGLMPAMYAKGGALGRSLRERSEGPQSEAYTKARAQMQSALMKLRKTQFGTQMTRLEKETGEEVFPSGAESPQRLGQMLTVLVGNAEQLRRGVYEANNAADLYQPIAPAETAPPVRPSPAQPATPAAQKLEQEFPDKAAQIQRARASGYTDAQIRARLIGGR